MWPAPHIAAYCRSYNDRYFFAGFEISDKAFCVVEVVSGIMRTAPQAFTANDTFVSFNRNDAFTILYYDDVGFVAGAFGDALVTANTVFVGENFAGCHYLTSIFQLKKPV